MGEEVATPIFVGGGAHDAPKTATNTAMQNKSRRDRRPRRSVLLSLNRGIGFIDYLFTGRRGRRPLRLNYDIGIFRVGQAVAVCFCRLR